MNNPGLTSRLRQQSRRTGLAVGFAMAAAIALCIGIFVVAYAELDPFTRDFVAQPSPTPTAEATKAGKGGDDDQAARATNTPQAETGDETAAAPTDTPKPTATAQTAFDPDYVSNDADGVNFRSGPGQDNDVVTVIEPSTPLKSTGNQATDDNGTVWMEFELEDGTTGWIRQIDAIPQG